MFVIKCNNYNWTLRTLGSKKEIEDNNLQEIKNSCSTCGKARKFLCKKCGQAAKMFRIK